MSYETDMAEVNAAWADITAHDTLDATRQLLLSSRLSTAPPTLDGVSSETAAGLASSAGDAWIDIWNNDTVDETRKQRMCDAMTAVQNLLATHYGHTPAMYSPGGNKNQL